MFFRAERKYPLSVKEDSCFSVKTINLKLLKLKRDKTKWYWSARAIYPSSVETCQRQIKGEGNRALFNVIPKWHSEAIGRWIDNSFIPFLTKGHFLLESPRRWVNRFSLPSLFDHQGRKLPVCSCNGCSLPYRGSPELGTDEVVWSVRFLEIASPSCSLCTSVAVA